MTLAQNPIKAILFAQLDMKWKRLKVSILRKFYKKKSNYNLQIFSKFRFTANFWSNVPLTPSIALEYNYSMVVLKGRL